MAKLRPIVGIACGRMAGGTVPKLANVPLPPFAVSGAGNGIKRVAGRQSACINAGAEGTVIVIGRVPGASVCSMLTIP